MTKRILLLPVFCLAFHLQAQQIHWDATLQNNHLWRGIEVADGLVLTTNINVSDANGHFRIGMWGGTNTSGSYKEFNFHATYQYKGFSLALWDTYNFSADATYNNKEFFNYKARETGRFLDAIASYRFKEKFPLLISWSTVLSGRDRNAANTANKYSTFCYAEYPVYRKSGWQVDAGVGGAFALNRAGDSSHFYGDTPGIIHTTLKVSRSVAIGNLQIPLFICALFNPQADRAFLQVGAQLFLFLNFSMLFVQYFL